MATVRVLADIGMRPIEAIHLGRDGLDLSFGGWTPMSVISNNTIVSVKDAAVYASASTFTVPADITSLVQKGDKIRWTQTAGVKYGYILSATYSAPNTTVTIAVNTNYTVANETITDFYISRESMPLGFPAYFEWSPSLVGFSANPTNTRYLYNIQNGFCVVHVRQATAGTSNSTDFTISTPITAATLSNGNWGVVCYQTFDNGAEQLNPGRAIVTSAGTTIIMQRNVASATWTAANGKMATFGNLTYPI